MFLKIFKHAFFRPLKTVVTMIIINVAICVLSGVLSRLADAFKDNVTLFTTFTSLAGLLASSVSIFAVIEMVAVYGAFYKAIATDEAYLTYTLPASTKVQLGARFLSLLAWGLIISAASSFALSIQLTLSGEIGEISSTIGGDINVSGVEADFVLLILEIILLVIVSELSFTAHVVFGALFVQNLSVRLRNKVAPVLAGLLFFAEFVLIGVVFVIILISFLLSPSDTITSIHIVLCSYIAILGALGGLAYYLSYKFMGRWLNLA